LQQRGVEVFEALAGPEGLLERLRFGAKAPKQDRLVDDDDPAPKRRRQEAQHDDLDDDMRRPEHLQKRGVGRDIGHKLASLTSGSSDERRMAAEMSRNSAETEAPAPWRKPTR
jgi:hypothetical protein